MYIFVFYFKIFCIVKVIHNYPSANWPKLHLIKKKNRLESNDTLFQELSPVVNPADDRYEESLISDALPSFYEDSAVTQDVATKREIVALFLFCIM